jgi:hypothetical protein
MQTPTAMARLTLGLAILLACATGCSRIWKTPAPTPTPIPSPPVDIPAPVLTARNAALDFIRAAYPDQAPSQDMVWIARTASPLDLSGVSYYEFASDGWLLAVNEVIVSASQGILFEIDLDNLETGFNWSGRLDADYTVIESNLDVSVEALIARDLVLAHVRERYPDKAPHEGIVWMGERTTAEGSAGHESYRFTADEWSMVVQYNVGRPDQASYQTELARNDEAFVWHGRVDAEGTVHELHPVFQ